MGAFKLETFEVATANDSLDGLRSSVLERERNEAYAQGFKDGVDVTSAAIDAEKNQRLAIIESALSELHVTHDLAARSIEASLAPLMSSFLSSAAPSLCDASLLDTVCDQVETAFRSTNRGGVRIIARPDLVDDLKQEFLDRSLVVDIDTERPPKEGYEAEIFWAGGVDVISMNATLDDLYAQIFEHFSQYAQGKANATD